MNSTFTEEGFSVEKLLLGSTVRAYRLYKKRGRNGEISIVITSRYPVGISTEFCFKWQKNLQGGKGKGIRGKKGGGGGGGGGGK